MNLVLLVLTIMILHYGVGYDRKSAFSFPGGVGFGQNVIFFGVDMSSSAHIDNKKKDILLLGKRPT